MALLLLMQKKDPSPWVDAIHAVDPDIDIRIWPDVGNPEDILFLRYLGPSRWCPLSFSESEMYFPRAGAGVDHILNDPGRPQHLPVARIYDPLLRRSVMEYVVHAVLDHYRQGPVYRHHQQRKQWHPEPAPRMENTRIGVMGLGQMGRYTAVHLRKLGFTVSGWSQNPKRIDDIVCFLGDDQFAYFLAEVDILICILPLTPWTRAILNEDTFNCLPKGAYLINIGRGEHLVERDLLTALQTGQLSGACLDVFQTEPLPPYHPFWSHPNIRITPHIAGLTDPMSVSTQIVENYRRALRGDFFMNLIETDRWY